jgi:hypothetical protein
MEGSLRKQSVRPDMSSFQRMRVRVSSLVVSFLIRPSTILAPTLP